MISALKAAGFVASVVFTHYIICYMCRVSYYIRLAMEEAVKTTEEVPVGAIVVANGKVISRAHNKSIVSHDPTAHAEVIALRSACMSLSTHILDECDMYVTLEPCAMCAQAISFARIRRLYFGAYNQKLGSVENGPRIFQYCHHVPEVYGGFLEQENSEILKGFFEKIRESSQKHAPSKNLNTFKKSGITTSEQERK